MIMVVESLSHLLVISPVLRVSGTQSVTAWQRRSLRFLVLFLAHHFEAAVVGESIVGREVASHCTLLLRCSMDVDG